MLHQGIYARVMRERCMKRVHVFVFHMTQSPQVASILVSSGNERMDERTNERMNECLTTPQHKNKTIMETNVHNVSLMRYNGIRLSTPTVLI